MSLYIFKELTLKKISSDSLIDLKLVTDLLLILNRIGFILPDHILANIAIYLNKLYVFPVTYNLFNDRICYQDLFWSYYLPKGKKLGSVAISSSEGLYYKNYISDDSNSINYFSYNFFRITVGQKNKLNYDNARKLDLFRFRKKLGILYQGGFIEYNDIINKNNLISPYLFSKNDF